MVIIGYTTGVFDLFHIGHLNILRNAKGECDYLVVGVTTDELSLREKGKRPIIPLDERMEIVRNIRFVDRVVPQASYDKMAAWREVRFNRMFVGDDWKGSPKWVQLEKDFAELGVDIRYFPYTKQTSSTKIREILERYEDLNADKGSVNG